MALMSTSQCSHPFSISLAGFFSLPHGCAPETAFSLVIPSPAANLSFFGSTNIRHHLDIVHTPNFFVASILLAPVALLTLLIVRQVTIWLWGPSKLNLYPPGPPGLPVVGNVFDVPNRNAWETFARWSEEYDTPVVHVNVFGQHMFVINSRRIAQTLFEKRSTIYSNRPAFPMVNLMGWNWNSSLLPYGPKWRLHRRLFQQVLKKDAVAAYEAIQEKKIYDLLYDLLSIVDQREGQNNEEGDAIGNACRLAAGGVIMGSVYGHDVTSSSDYFVSIAEQAIQRASENLLPGTSIINVFPSLQHLPRWLPGVEFHRLADDCRKLTQAMQDVPFNWVKEKMAQGTQRRSILTDLLEKNPGVDNENIKGVAATCYSAGFDTFTTVLRTFFLSVLTHPHVQRKAQVELDRVVGSNRLPTMADRPHLPYIEAIYREIMRWNPPLPLALPHETNEEDVVQDGEGREWVVPKGSYVMMNLWAMFRDESIYTSPDQFMPERFLNKNGTLNEDDTTGMVYGLGRRSCPGKHMASSSVWIAIASILATFNVAPLKDKDGNPTEVRVKFEGGAFSVPVPFKCAITPRSKEARTLIELARTEAF